MRYAAIPMSPACPIRRIVKRDGSTVPYDRRRIAAAIAKAMTATGRPDAALARDMARRVERALVKTYTGDSVPSVEDIQDVVENVLMENRFTKVARDYIIYRHRRAMQRAARSTAFEVTDNVPYRTIYDVLRWNIEHRCESVQALNRIVEQNAFPDLVTAAERRFQDDIDAAVRAVAERRDSVRIVIVAGPSSSGKTTTTARLAEGLARTGLTLKTVNIDNYFFDLERHPRDEFGDYDYETPQALDLARIDRDLKALLGGRAVRTPHYDFKTGKRTLDVHALSLARGELLLIDSLHGLFGGMTAGVPDALKFRIYVETLGQLRSEDGTFMRWADNRLLRRMIRDKQHRNLQPIETLTHWHYVRRSELKYIIPYIRNADIVLNTALPYELPLLRHRLFRYVSRAATLYRDDPARLDAHIRAVRLYDLLKPLKAVRDDSCVPADALLREFIGGSRYASA